MAAELAYHARPRDAQADRITELAAEIHAATAELARRLAAFDADGGWAGDGIRSCAHWLSINAGLDQRTAADLLRVGHALESLPLVAEAFACGRLSLDKVRALSLVTTPADQELWVVQATHLSATQLVRVCRAVRRALLAQDPEITESQLARRGLWTSYTEDGMLRLLALLPPDQGELVLTALRAVTGDWLPALARDEPVLDPALDRWAARRSDALLAITEHAMATAPTGLMGSPEARQLVVHVDVGVLTGEEPEGRCETASGQPLSAAVARRLGCDGTLVALTERDGLPIDVGRRRRLATGRQRLALRARDKQCRFPGCPIGAQRCEVHHHDDWIKGGLTHIGNMHLWCGWHHQRYHDGAFQVRKEADGTLVHLTRGGHVIRVPEPPPVGPNDLPAAAETPVALDGGAPCQFTYAVDILTEGCTVGVGPRAPCGP